MYILLLQNGIRMRVRKEVLQYVSYALYLNGIRCGIVYWKE